MSARWYTLPFRLLPQAATLAVVGGLAALGIWGHSTGWKREPGRHAAKAEEPEKKEAEEPAPPAPPASDAAPDPDFEPSRRPTHDARTCKLLQKTITLDDDGAVDKAGLRFRPVGEEPLTVSLPVSGTVAFTETAVARPPARAAGTVWAVLVEFGQAVAPGDLLALVESPDVARAKADFLAARVQVDARQARVKTLKASNTVSSQLVQDAETALREAELHLRTAETTLTNFRLPITAESVAGVPDKELAGRMRYLGLEKIAGQLAKDGAPGNLLPVFAETPGVVLDITAVKGDAVAERTSILKLADVRRMALLLEVRQEATFRLRRGLPVEFLPDGSDEPVQGAIVGIGKALDDRTRTVTVRVEVDNPPLHDAPAPSPEGRIDPPRRLLAGAYGSGTITLARKEKAVVVPTAAVQWEGCSHVVFVKHGEFGKPNPGDKMSFEVRRVRLGQRQGGLAEVLDGVKPGEEIVVIGSHALKTELFKDRLGEAE